MAILMNGKDTAASIRAELKDLTAKLFNQKGILPGIALLLIGEDPASEMYVKSKEKACAEIGFHSVLIRKPSETTEEEAINIIKGWNVDNAIHGILVQLPLPSHIDEDKIIDAIAPHKDVDGFHPISIGKMMLGRNTFLPCTPAGVLELMKRYNIDTNGKHLVVLGRSNIVGRPVANLMSMKNEHANAIVTLCHSAADDITYYTKQADILVTAIGQPEMVRGEDIKEGAVIIDVGINRVEDETRPRGYRVCGDCHFESVEAKASYITPVPGGIGPMTIAMLMMNTYRAATEKI
jgi:methylenetetrahydrofolate dehydrogenase (NADP+)/methenyltetrahydrofolate cyclohydrolase